ncbi:MAG: dihydropteroate synthase [Rhodocyclaceae bacterium]|nr:dihydropteroate synthase [Rhodocyclaceae bacterium]MBX3667774.1 dihydropteroate synthase [Rhodocyclaceae bacterium]
MGIVNVTPDSFSGDGLARDLGRAEEQALQMLADGADLIDIGGESSRPGAAPVSAQEEIDRVLPLLERLCNLPVPISVDTCKAPVMRAALAGGAALINDINALQAEDAVDTLAGVNAAVCIMHMQGEPRSMQNAPRYLNVVEDIKGFLQQRIAVANQAGIGHERICVDPGFCFGKALNHNLALLKNLRLFSDLGCTLLVGLSRKSMLGQITGRAVADRIVASVAAALMAVEAGARIVRVHDVAATRDAFAIWQAINEQGQDHD